jgi:L,D-transpeptidase catalytic domain
MRVRLGAGVGSFALFLAVSVACAPAGAQASSGCAAPKAPVVTTTTTVTTPTVTTTTTPVTTTTGTTTTPTTTTATITTPTVTVVKKSKKGKPKPVRVIAKTLSFSGLFTVAKAQVTVPDRSVEVTGTIRPYVLGQRFLVTESVGGSRVRTVKMAAKCLAGTNTGRFVLKLSAPRPGRVALKFSHAGTKTMKAFKLEGSFDALKTNVGPGATGRFVELVQQQLAALHLFIPQTGKFDLGTELALDAYHRLLGQGEGIETIGPKTLTALLDGDGTFHVRYPKQGNHAEGDLSDQLLAFIDDGTKVKWIFPISSGKPSTPTILGNFQIYYKEPEYTSDGMYFSSFFHGGYAIHGYNPAPDYPASHGCMRLPMVDAIPAFGWTRVGDWVDTYYT